MRTTVRCWSHINWRCENSVVEPPASTEGFVGIFHGFAHARNDELGLRKLSL
jgi:hypothetical protein